MHKIFRGYVFPLVIITSLQDEQLDLEHSYLECKERNARITIGPAEAEQEQESTNQRMYCKNLPAELTKELPDGIYSIELRFQDGRMAYYERDFANVVETAYNKTN
ncbi:MAG: hypothetical protein ACI4UO_02910 [Paludibacteraceae bacterium]